MTKENCKRLYDHYVEKGMTKEAKDMLQHYPDFEVKEKPEQKPKVEKKKNGT